MIGAPNSMNLNCKVRVMKEAPGPSVSEEIADIFTNYNIDNGKKMKDIRNVEKKSYLFFFTKEYGYKCIGLFATITKYDIWNRKLITFGCLRWPNLEEIVWVEKNWKILLCAERILPYDDTCTLDM